VIDCGHFYTVPDSCYAHLALAGMLATGSEDFKDVIVPILSDDNQQKRLAAYRTWSVRLSSLGTNWRETVGAWKEDTRVEFVSELLHQRYVPEITSFALSDTSMKVKQAAIVGLSWMGAAEEAAQLLEAIDANALEHITHRVDMRLFLPFTQERALAALQRAFETSADPLTRIRLLLKQAELGVTRLPELKEELGKVSGKIEDHQAHFLLRPALDIVQATDAEWVSAWIAYRVAEGSLWHETWIKLITSVPEELKEELIRRLETEDFKHAPPRNIVNVLAAGADTAMATESVSKALRTP